MEGDMEDQIKQIQDLNYKMVQRNIDLAPLGPDAKELEKRLVSRIIEAHDEIKDCLKKLSEIRAK